jgi:hypothetical protein
VSSLLTKPSTEVVANGSEGPGGASTNGSHPEPLPAARTCAKCGSPMQNGQDWCLQCGAVVSGGLGGGPGWRTGVAILATTAALVVGASVAAYAALTKPKAKTTVVALAVKPPAATVTPTTPTTPGSAAPGTTPVPGTPTTVTPATPTIPSQTSTPTTSGANNEANNALFPPETKTTKTPTATKTTSEPTKTSESTGSEGSEGKTSPEAPSPILLDTNAAGVYNPYNYPATLFGDPSLAIDGELKTAWTAQVQAEKAPNMAEGLVLDLKSPQKLGSVAVNTTTTGVTVEVYGANGRTLPASISAPEWKRLVGLKVLKKKSTELALKANDKGYRYIVLWLAKAQPSSTAASPGSVSINEFELFPPK